MVNVKIQRASPTAIFPTYGSEGAACMDLYADTKGMQEPTMDGVVWVEPHTTVKIPTGFAFQPPRGYCGLIFARSGLATKSGLRPANCVGVCDYDYTGIYTIAIHNDTDEPQVIHHGDRIAQLMFMEVDKINLIPTDTLEETKRGSGGFGSTGK